MRDIAIVSTLLHTGMRVGELHGLDRLRKDLTIRLEGLRRVQEGADLIEPAKQVALALKQAKERFLRGGPAEQRQIIATLGSNPTLTDRKLHIQTEETFARMGEGFRILYNCG